MSRIFLTKVWGFNPESYPTLGFSSEGGRNKFLKESKPGDWVIVAGTRAAPTEEKDRGRLLGKIQLGNQQVDVEEVLRSIGTATRPEDYHDDGTYRWPFGLPMLQAYRFVDPPDLKKLFGSYLSGTEWAAYALEVGEKLGTEAVVKINALQVEPVQIAEAPAIVRQRERQRSFILAGGATGPGPSTSRSGSEREAGVASAYLLELQGGQKRVYKVGYSGDVGGRIMSLNKGLISSVTGYVWKPLLTQPFTSEKQAYEFEQILHKRLRQSLVEGEQEIYSINRKDIEAAWSDILFRGDWAVGD